jgi:hypothetical protein
MLDDKLVFDHSLSLTIPFVVFIRVLQATGSIAPSSSK